MRARSGVIGPLAVAATVLIAAACGNSGQNDLERIDGPAVVDPDFRPLDSVGDPRSTEVVSPSTESGD